VNPATSQNSAEHTRRSATGPLASATGSAAACAAVPVSAQPHDRQNRLSGPADSPHEGQLTKGAPQSPQNRSPAPRDAPHRAHLSIRQL
jgi:hypothetical protein